MGAVRIGINGLGRIGRAVLRQALERENELEVVGVNDLVDPDDLAYLVRYDSVYGRLQGVESANGDLRVGSRRIPCSAHEEPARIPWGDLGAQVVIESTGAFRSRDDAAGHLEGGADRVVISAPSDDADATFVPGVNDRDYHPESHRVVSMASCTTNCLAPLVKVLHAAFGLEHALFTTVHAYTSSQSIVDGPARKRRRGRAAALNVIPTTTGAAQATERVLPELDGRIDGMAMRVPVPAGSITDLVARLGRDVDVDAVNGALREAAESDELEGILGVSDDDLVSQDIVGDRRSAIVDASSTRVRGARTAKVLAWYDNEWGYAARLVDFARRLGTMAARG